MAANEFASTVALRTINNALNACPVGAVCVRIRNLKATPRSAKKKFCVLIRSVVVCGVSLVSSAFRVRQ